MDEYEEIYGLEHTETAEEEASVKGTYYPVPPLYPLYVD